MTRSFLVLCCLVIVVFLATGLLPCHADSSCCARTYKCQLRKDCRCLMREIRCRDPSKGILNSGKKRSPPPDASNRQQQLEEIESSGFLADPRMQQSALRRAFRLASLEDTPL